MATSPTMPTGRRRLLTSETSVRYLRAQFDVVRGVAFSALYDICCWLADACEPVPLETPEYYWHGQFADLAHPRERLGRYCSPDLLRAWDAVVWPFLDARFRLAPALGDSATLREDGLYNGAHRVIVDLAFVNESAIIDDPEPVTHGVLPVTRWLLRLCMLVDHGSAYIQDMALEPASAETVAPVAGSPDPATLPGGPDRAIVNPLALLAAIPPVTPDLRSPGPPDILPNPLVRSAETDTDLVGESFVRFVPRTESERLIRDGILAGDSQSAYQIGRLLYAEGGRDEAEAWYAAAADAVYARALYRLGAVLEERGHDDHAEAAYRQAAGADHAGALAALVRMLREHGKDEQAERWSGHPGRGWAHRIINEPDATA